MEIENKTIKGLKTAFLGVVVCAIVFCITGILGRLFFPEKDLADIDTLDIIRIFYVVSFVYLMLYSVGFIGLLVLIFKKLK